MIFKILSTTPGSDAVFHHYKAAGSNILSHFPLQLLTPWYLGDVAAGPEQPAFRWPALPGDKLLYKGETWLGDRVREVRCRTGGSDFLLETEGLGGLVLSDSGRTVLYQGEDVSDQSLLEEFVVGPAFILSLAHRDTFTLHAAAVAIRGEAHLFVGDSGMGKSTTAAYLGEHASPDCRRISDDALPVCLRDGRPFVLPHYPQFKLPPGAQMSSPELEKLPVSAMYILDPLEGNEEARQLNMTALSPRDAALALVHHTIASRLFTAPLLSAHLDFCTKIASIVPIFRLRIPHRLEALPAVAEALGMSD